QAPCRRRGTTSGREQPRCDNDLGLPVLLREARLPQACGTEVPPAFGACRPLRGASVREQVAAAGDRRVEQREVRALPRALVAVLEVAEAQPLDREQRHRRADTPLGADAVAAEPLAEPAPQQRALPFLIAAGVDPQPGEVVVDVAHADALEVDQERLAVG